MRKLTVDEIIGGLVEAYEKLLILSTDPEGSSPAEYHQALGEVTALRWVLGQPKCSIDSTMPKDEYNFPETKAIEDEERRYPQDYPHDGE